MYQQVKLGDKFKLYRGSSPRPIINYISNNNSDPYWIKIGDMPDNGYIVNTIKEHISIEGAKKSRRVYKGDMILSNSMSFGKPYILNVDGYIHDGWFVIRNYERSFDRDYLRYLLASPTVQKRYSQIAAGGVVLNISSDLVNSVIVKIPSLDEQKKISSFLSVLDERIQVQNKIIEGLKSSIKAILDCFFAHETNSKIGNYITEVSERNKNDFDYPVFSVSNKKGFIPQQEQFEDKVIASDDKSSYKIVRKNMFAYNPARINVGSIDLYELDSPCIVSPMYNCFDVKEIDPMYLLMYFKSSFFINEMSKRLEGSVRMCLTMNGLKNLPIYIPSMNEMNRLINVYLVITRKLQNSTKLLNLYLKQKDYLLSNLFI